MSIYKRFDRVIVEGMMAPATRGKPHEHTE